MVVLGWFLIAAGVACYYFAYHEMRGRWRDLLDTLGGQRAVPPPGKVVVAVLLGSILAGGGTFLVPSLSLKAAHPPTHTSSD